MEVQGHLQFIKKIYLSDKHFNAVTGAYFYTKFIIVSYMLVVNYYQK